MDSFSLSEADRAALAWFCSVKNFNGSLGSRFLSQLNSINEMFLLSDRVLQAMLPQAALKAFLNAKANISPAEIMHSINKNHVRFITKFDPDYPRRLHTIPDAPLGIFVIGSVPSDDLPSVAIIGSRSCSEYGSQIARELGHYLGQNKVQVISGMAYGIDGISQSAALNAGGSSYAVLGTGADVCYPPSNKQLYETLKASGGIITTYGMGEPAIPSNFPPRNRIVSGLSDAVVVIEARQKSGTIITVDMALEQGREVYAVPGRITDRLSDGCNGLIGQGANVFLSPEIFLSELLDNESNVLIRKTEPSKKSRLHRSFSGKASSPDIQDEDQALIYEVLELTPISIDEICIRLSKVGHNFTYNQVSMLLMQMTLEGLSSQVSQGCFIKKL